MGLMKDAWDSALFPEDGGQKRKQSSSVRAFLEQATENPEGEEGDAPRGRQPGVWEIVLAGEGPAEHRGGAWHNAMQEALAGQSSEPADTELESDELPPPRQSLLRRTVGSGLQGLAKGMGFPEDTAGAFHGAGELFGTAMLATLIADTKETMEKEAEQAKVRIAKAGELEEARLNKQRAKIERDAHNQRVKLQKEKEREEQRQARRKGPPSATRVAWTQAGDTIRDHADGLGQDILTGLTGFGTRAMDWVRRTSRKMAGQDPDEKPVAGVQVLDADDVKNQETRT